MKIRSCRPKRTARKKIVVVVALGVIFALSIPLLTASGEPSYQGKTLTQWLRTYSYWFSLPSDRALATDAVQQIGTNAIPFLLRDLQSTDSPFKDRVRDAARVLRLPRILAAEEKRARGITGFRLLGAAATNALPQLEALLTHPIANSNALAVLIDLGFPAIPALVRALVHPNIHVRGLSAHTLGMICHEDMNGAVAGLMTLASDPDRQVRNAALRSLGKFPGETNRIVPFLSDLARDGNPEDRDGAARILRQYAAPASLFE